MKNCKWIVWVAWAVMAGCSGVEEPVSFETTEFDGIAEETTPPEEGYYKLDWAGFSTTSSGLDVVPGDESHEARGCNGTLKVRDQDDLDRYWFRLECRLIDRGLSLSLTGDLKADGERLTFLDEAGEVAMRMNYTYDPTTGVLSLSRSPRGPYELAAMSFQYITPLEQPELEPEEPVIEEPEAVTTFENTWPLNTVSFVQGEDVVVYPVIEPTERIEVDTCKAALTERVHGDSPIFFRLAWKCMPGDGATFGERWSGQAQSDGTSLWLQQDGFEVLFNVEFGDGVIHFIREFKPEHRVDGALAAFSIAF